MFHKYCTRSFGGILTTTFYFNMGLIETGRAIRELSILGLPFLEVVGLVLTCLVVVYFVPVYLRTIWDLWIKPTFSMGTNLLEMGKWAVVTGASDGIGKAFAKQLANLGLNIVLISRSKDKLDLVAEEIENQFAVETKVIAVDFTNGASVYDQIKESIEGLDVGVLINNVGMSIDKPNRFLECELHCEGSEKFLKDILFCNVFPVTLMTRLVLPGMISRKRGVVVNVGSLLGVVPTPFAAAYSATKAYTDNLTQSLAAEYENHGVIFQSLLPGFVHTKMIWSEKPSIFAPTPETYVRSALKTIGIEERTSAHCTHRMTKHVVELFGFLFPNLTRTLYFTLFEEMREAVDFGTKPQTRNI